MTAQPEPQIATYEFKHGARLTGDPARVSQELECIRRRTGGLSARAVQEAARSEHNYLHRYFEWDDSEAAQKYRDDQARHLIRSVVVRFVGREDTPVPAFVAVGTREDRYLGMATAMSSPAIMADVLAKALEELRWFRKKYAHLQALRPVIAAIDEALGGG